MVKEDAHYDLCNIMLKELMTNLKKIKEDKKNTFQYGSFIIYLVFYLLVVCEVCMSDCVQFHVHKV